MTPISWSSDSPARPFPSLPVTVLIIVASSGSGGMSAAGPDWVNRSVSRDPAGRHRNRPCCAGSTSCPAGRQAAVRLLAVVAWVAKRVRPHAPRSVRKEDLNHLFELL